MKAALCSTVNQIKIVDRPLPKITSREILLKVHLCGVCGSDLKKLEGAGLASPKTLGHEVVGVVSEVGKDVRGFAVGERLVVSHHVPCFDCHYCRHKSYSMCKTFKESNLDPGGFSQYLRVPQEHLQFASFRIPEQMSDELAIFTEPLACCLRCLHRISPLSGDHVTLIGFGSIGILFLALLKRLSINVHVLDLDEERLQLAARLGAKILHPKRDVIREAILAATQGRGTDAVLFTAGNAQMVKDSFSFVRDGGTLCLFSELKEEEGLVHFKDLYKREIRLLSSYSPGPEDLREAFEILSSGQINLSGLKSEMFALDEIPRAIQMILERKILKAVIQPQRLRS